MMTKLSRWLLAIGAAGLLVLLGAIGGILFVEWRTGQSWLVADAGRTAESYARDRICVSLLQLAKADLAVREFKAEHGKLPGDLTEALGKPVRDAWNNEIVYRSTEGGESYTLVSPGPDHTLNTADDEVPDELVPDGLLGDLPDVPKKCLASAPTHHG